MEKKQKQKRLTKLLFATALSSSLLLTGCTDNKEVTEVTEQVDEFLRACGNEDYGIAVGYVADEEDLDGYSETLSDDETGLIWVRIPDLMSEAMSGASATEISARKFVSHGLGLMYGNYKIEDVSIKDDVATVIISGKGPVLEWPSTEEVKTAIGQATNDEFISDYSYYKDKIESSSQEEVYNDIQSSVTSDVFDEYSKKLEEQESIEYQQQITMKKDENGDWKVTKVVFANANTDDSDADWFGN